MRGAGAAVVEAAADPDDAHRQAVGDPGLVALRAWAAELERGFVKWLTDAGLPVKIRNNETA